MNLCTSATAGPDKISQGQLQNLRNEVTPILDNISQIIGRPGESLKIGELLMLLQSTKKTPMLGIESK
jgi:hypothetical protein